jgi:predicted lipid carrier protein YhbT
VVDLVLDWHRRNIGYVVGKRAKAPEGAVVEFALEDAAPITVAVRDGRATVVDEADASATLTLDVEAFNALLCGRWSFDDALDKGRLRIDGDAALGRRVAEAMAYVS